MTTRRTKINKFAQHTRSTAFSLSLSATAIDEILYLDACKQIADQTDRPEYGMPLAKGLRAYLERRGLIQDCTEVGCAGNSILTSEGHQVAVLLRMAGFSNFLDDQIEERVWEYHEAYSRVCKPRENKE